MLVAGESRAPQDRTESPALAIQWRGFRVLSRGTPAPACRGGLGVAQRGAQMQYIVCAVSVEFSFQSQLKCNKSIVMSQLNGVFNLS